MSKNPFIRVRAGKFAAIMAGEADELANDGIYGKAFAQYLQFHLASRGYSTPLVVCEDWGWWVTVNGLPFGCGLCVYGWQIDDTSDLDLCVTVSAPAGRRWSWRRFRFIDTTPDRWWRNDPMTTNLPSGVWSYPSGFPGYDDVMWIDEARRRIITFVVGRIDPVRRLQMRIWYLPESPTSMRTGLRPVSIERVQEFRLEKDRLVWLHPGIEQPWRRLSVVEYPDWLEAEVAAAHAKMDEIERSAE